MTALHPSSLELLDFLCAARNAHCRVRHLKTFALQGRLARLRDAGLVEADSHDPTPWALADWKARQNATHETPAPAPIEERADPPLPEAGGQGGGAAARNAQASPPKAKRKGPPSMAERARRFEQQRAKKNTRGAAGTAREAPSVEESTSAKTATAVESVTDTAPPFHEPGPVEAVPARPSVDIKVNARRDPTQPPATPLTDVRARNGARAVQRFKRSIRKQAQAALDAGIAPADASPNAGVRGAMKELAENRAEQARLADPIEQAKTFIRRKTRKPVFAAHVTLGDKGRGLTFVGNQCLTENELLDYAKRLEARG